jgi:toxin YoeB
MAKYTIEVKPLAEKHLIEHLKSGDKASIKKLKKYLLNFPKTHLKELEIPNN